MGHVLIRNVDEGLKEQLKESARENGRSLGAEIHERLRDSFGGPDPDFWRDFGKGQRDHGFTEEDIKRIESIKREPIPEQISFD